MPGARCSFWVGTLVGFGARAGAALMETALWFWFLGPSASDIFIVSVLYFWALPLSIYMLLIHIPAAPVGQRGDAPPIAPQGNAQGDAPPIAQQGNAGGNAEIMAGGNAAPQGRNAAEIVPGGNAAGGMQIGIVIASPIDMIVPPEGNVAGGMQIGIAPASPIDMITPP